MVKAIHRNFLHLLFVAGFSLLRDVLGLGVGFTVLLIAVYLFSSNFQDIYKIVLGIPLIVIAVSVLLTNFFGIFLSLFNRSYQINNCPFCRDK
jgi:hypothetical protein